MVTPYETEENNNEDGKGSKKTKAKPELPVYKYSKMGREDLYESIILGGIPIFVTYDERNNKLNPIQNIEEATRILVPPNIEEYPYMPYEFESEEELDEYVQNAKNETRESLYRKVLSFVKTYNDQDEYKQILIATDLVWSYFQDKFSTTHYEGVVGDVGSGKSTVGDTFEVIGYRCINTTNPSAPNVFRILGMIEPGQCTLILDESDMIDENPDMMSILKTGYDYLKRVPKTNTNSWKQEFFFTYCLKIIIAERSLNQLKARGVNDRTFSYTTYVGDPEGDIKEVMMPQGDPYRERELDRLMTFRKLMLVYRLMHFKDPITDIDIGVKGRNKELCKPYIQLFYGTNVQEEIEQTLQKYLDTKNQKKSTSLEYALLPIITELINEERSKLISVSRVWQKITTKLDGQSAFDKPEQEFHSTDHGTLYRTTITKIICDKFGAEPKRGSGGKREIFFNLGKLQKIQKSYNIEVKIKTTLKNNVTATETGTETNESSDSSDGIDSILDSASNIGKENGVNVLKYSQEVQTKIENTLPNKPYENTKEGEALPQDLSLPSMPSLFSCNYCEFQNANQYDYDKHTVIRHPNQPGYPDRNGRT